LKRINVPFKLLVPFFYLTFYFFWLLVVAFWPLFLLYRVVLRMVAGVFWVNPTRDVLVVYNSPSEVSEYASQLLPLLEGRAVSLDYSERKRWRSFSFPTQLFHCFGPKPIPEFVMPHFLPVVIVFRKFGQPKTFGFGARSRDRENNFVRLRTELEKKPTLST
jgi:hypothetical protein